MIFTLRNRNNFVTGMLPMLSSHPQSCLCILHSFWKKKFQHIPKDPTGEEWKAVQIWNHPSYPPENLLSSTPMFNHSASPLNANGRSNKLQCNWNYVFDDCYSCHNRGIFIVPIWRKVLTREHTRVFAKMLINLVVSMH